MLGYMSAKEAKCHGFTHHGSYYGIPVWMGEQDGLPMVATKWLPMEWVMTLFHYLEGAVRSTCFPHDEPSFTFKMGKPID